MALEFHKEAFAQLLEDDGLLIMARGLGLYKIFLNFIKLYCSEANSKQLTFILNVSASDQQTIIEELLEDGISTQRIPKRMNVEYSTNDRAKLYMEGGVYFISSPTLVMDMLYKRVPPHLINGILIHQCEGITDTCAESFALRLFRQHNKTGFIKGFSEYPEAFGRGFCKVEKVMKNIYVKKLFLWPRFRDIVDASLQKHRPDVVELHQPFTPSMKAIQNSVLEIMEACIDELKKNTLLDLTDITVEDGLFREFDVIVKSQLEPVWHKVSAKTRQLVSDLRSLRKLLQYLVEYDSVSFYRYLETWRLRELGEESVWLFMDAADSLFRLAKSRVFTAKRVKDDSKLEDPKTPKKSKVDESVPDQKLEDSLKESESQEIDLDMKESKEEEDSENPHPPDQPVTNSDNNTSDINTTSSNLTKITTKEGEVIYQPTLEGNPKWQLLLEVLREIEQEDLKGSTGKAGKVLVMVKDERTCTQLQEVLEVGIKTTLERRFIRYLETKTNIAESAKNAVSNSSSNTRGRGKGRGRGGRGRGKSGGRGGAKGKNKNQQPKITDYATMLHNLANKSSNLSFQSRFQRNKEVTPDDLLPPSKGSNTIKTPAITVDMSNISNLNTNVAQKQTEKESQKLPEGLEEFEQYFGVLPAPHIVIQSMASRKRVLEELRPKYVIIYDPDIAFFRQLEVYKSENVGAPLRVYWLWYGESVEEKRYIAGLNKEDKAFKDLIREKAVMSVSSEQDGKTVIELPESTLPANTRKGGKFSMIKKGNKVIVDSREFRSALPSILHQKEFEILPATLETGDYIITNEIAVERKSISDLYSSFNSGRLYTQATNLTKHFKKPSLLIEFSEDRPFGFNPEDMTQDISPIHIISKIVILTMHFPSLRLLWSRSPHAAAKLFEELKANHDDPDITKAPISGTNEELRDSPETILRTMPGITSYNYKIVMQKVRNLHELSRMSKSEIIELIGSKNGTALYEYFNTVLSGND